MSKALCRLTEPEARLFLEGILWPNGPVCPHCKGKNVSALNGKTCRPGLKNCRDCRKQFTVTVGTIFERTHVPLQDWVYAFARMNASKKGISALQLQRELDVQYKTAWFMCHRIRHAMAGHGFDPLLKGDVTADETYVGGKPRKKSYNPGDPLPEKNKATGRGTKKIPVMVMVEAGGRARARVLADVTAKTLRDNILANVDLSSTLHTDELAMYTNVGRQFEGGHRVVKHSIGQYTLPGTAGTNWAESYFALIKRGVYGNFHHVSGKHLFRYMAEFEFRWNHRGGKDGDRTVQAIRQSEGKRLMYKGTVEHAAL